MPEPQIRYARTSDGVSIAYTTIGDGPSILFCADHSLGMQHLLDDTAPPSGVIRALPARAKVTTFDAAGIGASQRDVSDFSLDAQVRAIEAVAAHLAASPFTVVAGGTASASAALYATRQPGRVRQLVCIHPAFPIVRRTGAAIRDNWSLDRRRWAGTVFPDGPVSSQRWLSAAMRESTTAEVAAAYWEAFAEADLRAIYQRIPVSTLLCVAKTGPAREASLALASVVPSCRVATVSTGGDRGAAVILEFMGIDAVPANAAVVAETSVPTPLAAPPGMAVVLFTDIVDSTALTERLGDTAFRTASRTLDEGMRTAMRESGGTPVEGKVLGDGVMGVFTSASQAITAARRCIELSAESELQLHVGLHAGDVIHEKGNVYGGAVNIASRICGLSAPGEVLVSGTVRELARTSAGVVFEDRGKQALKGIDDAVRVYEVRWRE